ncbi:unnamed protein product [Closterium sp. NIES-54]
MSGLLLLLVRSAPAARARVARVVAVAAGVVVVGAVEAVEVAEVVAVVGVVAGVWLAVVAAVGVVEAAVVAVGVELLRGEVFAVARGSSSSVGERPLCPSSFLSGLLSVGRLGVSASPLALACPAPPSLRRGAVAHRSSLLLVSPDDCSLAESPHGHEGLARVSRQGRERYFLLVVDDYTCYTTVFPLRSKSEVPDVLIPWLRAVHLQLRDRIHKDLPVLRLHSDKGGEFSSDLSRDFCHGEGILQWFTLPASPQKNGIAERHIGLVMEVARTSMIHAVAPHFLWPFATGKVGDASVFRVWGSRAFVRDTSADKLSSRAIPCVFLSFPPDAPGWQFYHPTSRRVLPSQDVTFDEKVPFYHFFLCRTAPLFPPGPAPSGVSQVDPLSGAVPVKVAVDSGATRGAASGGAAFGGATSVGDEPEGAEPGGAESERVDSGGAKPRGAERGGNEPGGEEHEGAESKGVESGGAEPRGNASPRREPLSPQQLREWVPQRTRLRSGVAGAGGYAARGIGAGGAGATSLGVAGVSAGAGGTEGAGAAGPGGARTRGTGAAGAGGVGGAGARDPRAGVTGAGAGDPGIGGARAGGTGAGGAGAVGAGAGDPGAGGAGARGAGAGGTGAEGTVQRRPFFVPPPPLSLPPPDSVLCQVLNLPSSTGLTPSLMCPSPDQSQPQLLPDSPLPPPSPYVEQTDSFTEPQEPESHPASPVRAVCSGRRVPRSRPPPVPGTYVMALRPSSVPLRVPLPSPLVSSLPDIPEPESDLVRAASPTIPRLLATVFTDPSFEATAASALVAELVDFATAYRLDYATSLVPESETVFPPSVAGECALGTNVLVDTQEDFECLATAVPHLVAMLLAPEGDPDAPDIPTPRSNAEAITGPQWSLQRLVYGLRQAPREWHDTLRTSLAARGFAPSSADPSLFLRTDTSLPLFYILVYVDDLVFATADTEELALVKLKLQKRHTCIDLGELRSYLGLHITQDRARRTITLNQSHMVHQVLKRFGFWYSSPQSTSLPTGQLLSAPPLDESVEPSGPSPELPARRTLLLRASRPSAACTSRPAAASASRSAAQRVAPYCSQRVVPYCSQRVAPCCPASRALLQPARCALLQPARRALLPCASRPAAASASLPAAASGSRPAAASASRPTAASASRSAALRPAATTAAAAAARAIVAAGGGAAGSAGSAAGAGGAGGATRSAGGAAGAGGATRSAGGAAGARGAGPTTDRHCLSWPLSRQLQRLRMDGGGHCLSRMTPPLSSFASGFFSELVQVVEALVFYVLHRGGSRAAALGASESAATLGASESAAALGAHASPATGPSSTEALHTFTLDSGASRCFFRDCTTLTPLAAPVPTLLWHHRLGHPSLPRLRNMHSRLLVSGLPRSLPSLPRSPAPPCLPCVEGRQRTAPHSSEFPQATAPLQTLHMDVWGPAPVGGTDQECYFLLVVDDYTRYTTVFPLRCKADVSGVLIPWIRATHRQLCERFCQDFPVLRLRSDRGGEFSSDLLVEFCRDEGIVQSFTLPTSPQQNGIAERRIGLIVEVARTSMIHVAAPHFQWPFAVQYVAHQLNLWLRGPAPSGVSQVDPPPLVEPLEISSNSSGPAEGGDPSADDTAATRRSPRLETPPGFPPRPSSPPLQPAIVDSRAETAGAKIGGAEIEGEGSGGAATGGAMTGGATTGGAATRGAGSWGTATGGADSGGPASPSGSGAVGDPAGSPGAGQPPQPDLLETLSPQAICAWIIQRGSPGGGGYGPAGAGVASPGGAAGAGGTRGAAGAGGARATSPRGATCAGGAGPTSPGGTASAEGAGGAADAGGTGAGGSGGAGTGGAGAAGAGGARTRGAGAAGAGGAGGATGATSTRGARGTTGARGPGAVGASGAAGAGGAGVAAGATGAGGAGAAGARGARAASTALRRPFFYPQPQSSLPPPDSVLCQVLSLLSSTGLPLPLLCPPTNQSQPQLLLGSPVSVPTPHTEVIESLTERCEPETCASTPVRARRVTRPRPPTVPGTHGMALRPSSVPQRVVLPEPPASSLPHVPDPESDLARAASPTDTRLLATVVSDPGLESTATFSLVTELVDFAARSHLDYVTSLFELECLAAALPRFASMLLCPEGDPDALDIPTLRSYTEAQARYVARGFNQRMGVEFFQNFSLLRSLDFPTTFLQGSLHKEMWLRRPPGFTESFPTGTQWSLRRPVYGLRQALREWHDTLRTTFAALGFAPSSADPSLFLRTDTTLPPFYVLVYVDNLVFATADTKVLALVNAELQERHTCTYLAAAEPRSSSRRAAQQQQPSDPAPTAEPQPSRAAQQQQPSRPAAAAEPPFRSRAVLRSRAAQEHPIRSGAAEPPCDHRAAQPALPAVDFEVWVDDLQLFLQCDRADGLSLFDLASGASPAPDADADPTVRSQWATRDAAARLAVRRHLPTTERAHFSQYKSAQTLYNAVVARYSSPATAALSRLALPFLFPDLAAFHTVADLITHLRTIDTRYRAALPADFCAKNPPPMYLTLYFLVTCLPDSLRVVRDHFLTVWVFSFPSPALCRLCCASLSPSVH